MNLERNETQTSRVASTIEEQICNREFQPGQKLVGTRELSELFSVSRSVVRSALDLLMKKQLLISESRRGYYVNPALLSLNKIELGILSYKNNDVESYLEEALDIHHNHEYFQNFNLTLRCIGGGIFNCDIFRNEVNRYKFGHAQLLVLSGSHLDRTRIEILQESGIPFLVLGELSHDLPDVSYNQIYEKFCSKGRFIGDFIAQSNYQSAAYIAFPDGMLDYEMSYRDLIRERVMAAGKSLHIEFMSPTPNKKIGGVEQVAAALYRMFKAGNRPDIIHISEVLDYRKLLPVFAEFNLRIPQDVTILVYSKPIPSEPFGILKIVSDYVSFGNAVFLRLQEIRRNPELTLKLDFSDLVKRSICTINVMQ